MTISSTLKLGPLSQRRRQPQSHHLFQRSRISMRTLEQWAFFTLVVLPLYITVLWCHLSRPISTSLLQFSMATMVWSAHPIMSLLHNENMATSYAGVRTLTLQPILPAAAANPLATFLPCSGFRWRAISQSLLRIRQYVRAPITPKFDSVSEPLATSWVRHRNVTQHHRILFGDCRSLWGFHQFGNWLPWWCTISAYRYLRRFSCSFFLHRSAWPVSLLNICRGTGTCLAAAGASSYFTTEETDLNKKSPALILYVGSF